MEFDADWDAKNLLVVFCVTCMKRDAQLIAAMTVNVSLWWCLRKYWRLVIVTFTNDDDVQEKLQEHLKLAIESGNVVLASGGEAGRLLAVGGNLTHRPEWMPETPLNFGSAESQKQAGSVMPPLIYWHASVAKNSSHMAAIFAFEGEKKLLINLDCDQLVPAAYVRAALNAYSNNYEVKGFCLSCSDNGALTGRLGYHADDFLHINGYDERGPPSSGQDLDIRRRMDMMARQNGLNPKVTHVWLNTKELCGVALPNDFADTSIVHDRGYSKVVNCDPAILATLNTEPSKLWTEMKEKSQDYWKKLWHYCVIRRNLDVSKEKAGLGSWWAITARRFTRPENMLLSSPANVSSAAASQGDVDMPPVGLELQSGRQVPQRAQSMECCEKAITVEVLTIGVAEMKWKFDTSISSLGRRSEHGYCVLLDVVVTSCTFRITP